MTDYWQLTVVKTDGTRSTIEKMNRYLAVRLSDWLFGQPWCLAIYAQRKVAP